MGLYRLKVNAADGAYRLSDESTGKDISDTAHRYLFGVSKSESTVTKSNPLITLNYHPLFQLSLDDTIIVESWKRLVLRINLSEVVIQTGNDSYEIAETENKETLYMYFYANNEFGSFVVKNKQNAIPSIALYNAEYSPTVWVRNLTKAD